MWDHGVFSLGKSLSTVCDDEKSAKTFKDTILKVLDFYYMFLSQETYEKQETQSKVSIWC